MFRTDLFNEFFASEQAYFPRCKAIPLMQWMRKWNFQCLNLHSASFVTNRSRPIVNTSASLTVYPTMINPEEKNCLVTSGNTSIPVSWWVLSLSQNSASSDSGFLGICLTQLQKMEFPISPTCINTPDLAGNSDKEYPFHQQSRY